jgi:lipid II:glycine glycyltransferase (peptidoglycan interpeptide bridge formation enzyme)
MAVYTYSPISDKDYANLVKKTSFSTFYNSPERLQFIRKRNRRISLFQIVKEGSPVALACYQVIPARSGEFVYFQHSPLFIDPRIADDITFWKELKEFATLIGMKEQAVYVRFTPRIPNTKEIVIDILNAGFKRAPVQELDACVTRFLSVDQYKETQIRTDLQATLERAQKKGLQLDFSEHLTSLEDFISVYRTLSAKHQVDFVPVDYLKDELKIYLEQKQLIIATVKDSKDVIHAASAIVLQGNQAWNYWSVTTSVGIDIGADTLLLHETMLFLKTKKVSILDLWGGTVSKEIAEKGLPHPWKIQDNFKQGFGAVMAEYIPAIDVLIKAPQYMAAGFYQRALMLKRGYPYLPLKVN